MKRRDVLAGLAVACLGAAGAVYADDFVAALVRDLQQQGYVDVTTERTLLGRVRIVATRDDARREIIMNPRTGEILRDILILPDGGVRPGGARDDDDGADDADDDGSDDGGDDDSGDDSSDDSGSDDGSDSSDD